MCLTARKTRESNPAPPLTAFVALEKLLTFLNYNFLFCKYRLPYRDFMRIKLDNVCLVRHTRAPNNVPFPALQVCLGGDW